MSADQEPQNSSTISARLYDGSRAEAEMEEQLDEAGAVYERIGWDYYDNSIELYDVPADHRLPEDAQRAIHAAGFSTAYVNHTDKWDTHYRFAPNEPFKPSDGWRVSYGHKRDDGGGPILVEKPVDSWPSDWLKTGYVKVVTHG